MQTASSVPITTQTAPCTRGTPRYARHSFTIVIGIFVLSLSTALTARAADPGKANPLRLLVPYPITGPREIQSSDRITRRYRALAAHTMPPITDAMAATIEAALLVGLDLATTRTRRDEPRAFDRLLADDARDGMSRFDLLLAGDDLLRTHASDTADPRGHLPILARVVEPLAAMPYMLLCRSDRCAGRPDPSGVARSLRSVGYVGETSTSSLAARAWSRQLGLGALHVNYSGGNGVVTALVAGQVDAAFVALPLALGHMRHEKLRPLAIASEHRSERAPDVPTLRETGVPLVAESWFALFGSERLGKQAITRLGAAVSAYRNEPATRAEWLARGLVPLADTVEQFRSRIEADGTRSLAR